MKTYKLKTVHKITGEKRMEQAILAKTTETAVAKAMDMLAGNWEKGMLYLDDRIAAEIEDEQYTIY